MKPAHKKPGEKTQGRRKRGACSVRPAHPAFLVFCAWDFSTFRACAAAFLAMGVPLDVYFALQKENYDLDVIKALNQLKSPNRAD